MEQERASYQNSTHIRRQQTNKYTSFALLGFSLSMIVLGCTAASKGIDGSTTSISVVQEKESSIERSTTVPNITLINYSSFATTDLQEWVNFAESKMANRTASILAFIFPVGESLERRINDTPFYAHQVMLTQGEINSILSDIDTWLRSDNCVGKDLQQRHSHLEDYRLWLEAGADASTMQALCPKTRVIAMGITTQMREREGIQAFQNFLIHEFYHAFQQDLEMEGECRTRANKNESNSIWFIEGAAHYFATHAVAELNNDPDPRNNLLQNAYQYFLRERGTLFGSRPDIAGAAALQLLVEQGLLEEHAILDGSLFHACARELRFESDSSEIQAVWNSWNLITENDGAYEFFLNRE